MTLNQSEYSPEEEQPATPTHDGTLQFLGPDTVKYISPPRVEIPRSRVPSRPPPPPIPSAPSTSPPLQQAPPSYQSSVYPQMPPPMAPIAPPMPMMVHPQYHPQMLTSPPQMMYMPQPMMTGMMAAPMMMAPQVPPMQMTPPQQQQTVQQPSPAITLCINQSPQSTGALGISEGGGGSAGALVCPKCRKGIITREQDRFRKRLYLCLALFCCPLTCGLPLICLCCNYVDTCACCGKSYGHRGRKSHKKKVNAVKL